MTEHEASQSGKSRTGLRTIAHTHAFRASSFPTAWSSLKCAGQVGLLYRARQRCAGFPGLVRRTTTEPCAQQQPTCHVALGALCCPATRSPCECHLPCAGTPSRLALQRPGAPAQQAVSGAACLRSEAPLLQHLADDAVPLHVKLSVGFSWAVALMVVALIPLDVVVVRGEEPRFPPSH